jgi:hypothetical protein
MKDQDRRTQLAAWTERVLGALTIVAAASFVAMAANYALTRGAALDVPLSGTPLALQDVDWKRNGTTLVIATQAECPHCDASMPFYSDLVRSNRDRQFTPIVVVPHAAAAGRAQVKAGGLEVDDVKEVDFRSLKIPATPAILVVDADGVVKKVWVGRLTASLEQAVFERLRLERRSWRSQAAIDRPRRDATHAKLRELLDRGGPVIDTRSRRLFRESHLAGSLSMPLDELEVRLRREVPKDRDVVMVCEYSPTCPVVYASVDTPSPCDFAARVIKAMGYDKLHVVTESLDTLAIARVGVVRSRG